MPTFFDKEITEKYNDKETLKTVLTTFFGNYKQNELEILIGNNSINQEQFSNILRALKSTNGAGYFESVPERNDTLDISVYRNKNKLSQLKNFRITIPDALKIQEHCKSDSLKQSEVKCVYQKKKPINRVNISDYNIIINHKEEKNLERNDREMRDYLDLLKLHSNKYSLIYKTYRMKNRYSFLSTGTYMYGGCRFRLRLDITMIKQTDEPCQQFIKSGVMNKENQYEIELEFVEVENISDDVGDVDDVDVDTLFDEYKYLEKIITKIICMKNNYPYIISKAQEDSIKIDYLEAISSLKSGINSFINPRPVSLELQHLKKIKKNYCVTDKADGVSKLLYINGGGELYLIDYNMRFYKTEITCPTEELHDTIINGEYLNLDKDKNLINLFMAYDIYYYNGDDVSGSEFRNTDNNDNNDRYSKLQDAISIIATCSEVAGRQLDETVYPEGHMPIKVQNPGIVIRMKKFEFVDDKKNIFECSKTIWDKYTGGEYKEGSADGGVVGGGGGGGESKGAGGGGGDGISPYKLDGLIYTPTNVGVGNFLGKTWFSNYKWKPEYDNTIDFLIKEDKVGIRSVPISEIGSNCYEFEYIKYKTFTLNVGYNVPKDKYCSQFDSHTNNYISRKFTPSNPTLGNAHVAKLEIDSHTNNIYGNEYDHETGMWGNTRDRIRGDTIVEFAYINSDIAGQDEFNWMPVRTRYDKTKEYKNFKLTGEGRPNYGNNHYTANSVWNNIFNPVTESMITTGKGISSNSIYYMRDLTKKRAESNLINLQTYHNRIIKGECLLNYATKMVKLAKRLLIGDLVEEIFKDEGVGIQVEVFKTKLQGNKDLKSIIMDNDLQDLLSEIGADAKFNRDELKAYLFKLIHPNKINLLDMGSGKAGDLYKWDKYGINNVVGIELSADNIYNKTDGACERYVQYCKSKQDESIDCTFLEGDGGKTDFGLEEVIPIQFDIISFMFSIHYMINGDEMYDNINKYLKPGGLLVGACMDSTKISGQDIMEGKTEDGELLWKIKKNRDKLDVYIQTIGQTIKENVVNMTELISNFSTKCGLNEISVYNFDAFDKMPQNIKGYAKKLYNKMSLIEQNLSKMYNLFILKRGDCGEEIKGDCSESSSGISGFSTLIGSSKGSSN